MSRPESGAERARRHLERERKIMTTPITVRDLLAVLTEGVPEEAILRTDEGCAVIGAHEVDGVLVIEVGWSMESPS